MPGFPDKFMPFMDEPPGAKLSSSVVTVWGRAMRGLRQVTMNTLNKEPSWRHTGAKLTTGYHLPR
jgi:hydrogenase small subunit